MPLMKTRTHSCHSPGKKFTSLVSFSINPDLDLHPGFLLEKDAEGKLYFFGRNCCTQEKLFFLVLQREPFVGAMS
jgi:hypothetical protein